MCADPVTLTVIGLTIAAGVSKAAGQRQAGEAQGEYYDYLAEISRQEGEIALRTGAKQSELIQDVQKEEGKQLKKTQGQFAASQTAALAAKGVEGVTVEDISNTTAENQKLDELQLRYNADIRSWGVTNEASYKNWTAKSKATQFEFSGANARQAGKTAAFNTLLGTAVSIATPFALKIPTPSPALGGTTSFMGRQVSYGTTPSGYTGSKAFFPKF